METLMYYYLYMKVIGTITSIVVLIGCLIAYVVLITTGRLK